MEIFQFLATFTSALFAGAALYVNLVEHPARVSCGIATALAQWAPSYRRATWMQAPLAIIGLVSALIAWLAGASYWWLIGAVLLGAVVPFTFLSSCRPTSGCWRPISMPIERAACCKNGMRCMG